MTTATQSKERLALSSEVPSSYIGLPLSVFDCPAFRRLNVYCLLEGQNEPTLLVGASQGLSADKLEDLRERGLKRLLVRRYEFESRATEMVDALEDLLADDTVSPQQRFAILQEVVAIEVDRSFRSIDRGQFVSVADRVGRQVSELIGKNSVTPDALFSLAKHDTTTFVHVTNVTAYAAMLAQQMGLPEDVQQQIAVGAMLHDVGKRSLPAEILNKPGALTASERQVVQEHPRLGYVELCDRSDLSHGQLMMVYQHHEWVNGGGYPVAIVEEEIHPWAKLVAVVDVFDALTARRPYRTGASSQEALSIIEEGSGTQFDPRVVECWKSMFPQ